MTSRWTSLLSILALLGACAPAPLSRPPQPISTDEVAPIRADLPPSRPHPGRGTLHQDQFTIQLRSGALLVKVTPLAEEVIVLAAPDTYERLHALAESQAGAATAALSGAGALIDGNHPRLFLVSFFSRERDTPFEPEALHLTQQGQLYRPVMIRPLTPGWGAARLPHQEVRNAVYGFGAALDLTLPFTVDYDLSASEEWGRILRRLQVERGRVGAAGSLQP